MPGEKAIELKGIEIHHVELLITFDSIQRIGSDAKY